MVSASSWGTQAACERSWESRWGSALGSAWCGGGGRTPALSGPGPGSASFFLLPASLLFSPFPRRARRNPAPPAIPPPPSATCPGARVSTYLLPGWVPRPRGRAAPFLSRRRRRSGAGAGARGGLKQVRSLHGCWAPPVRGLPLRGRHCQSRSLSSCLCRSHSSPGFLPLPGAAPAQPCSLLGERGGALVALWWRSLPASPGMISRWRACPVLLVPV